LGISKCSVFVDILELRKRKFQMKKFEKEIEIRWSDADPNRHVRHSAFYEYGAHVRIRFFAAVGFDSKEMEKIGIGPILFKEECSFIKEVHVDDTIMINILKGEISKNGARWILHHEMLKEGKKCAHLTVTGAWMDLSKRKLTTPPIEIAKAFHALPNGENYVYKKQK